MILLKGYVVFNFSYYNMWLSNFSSSLLTLVCALATIKKTGCIVSRVRYTGTMSEFRDPKQLLMLNRRNEARKLEVYEFEL